MDWTTRLDWIALFETFFIYNPNHTVGLIRYIGFGCSRAEKRKDLKLASIKRQHGPPVINTRPLGIQYNEDSDELTPARNVYNSKAFYNCLTR